MQLNSGMVRGRDGVEYFWRGHSRNARNFEIWPRSGSSVLSLIPRSIHCFERVCSGHGTAHYSASSHCHGIGERPAYFPKFCRPGRRFRLSEGLPNSGKKRASPDGPIFIGAHPQIAPVFKHLCRSTISPRLSCPTRWNELLPISMPITAIALLSFCDMACSLSVAPLASFTSSGAGTRTH